MAVTGDLGTMPLVELLQWAGGNQKTGVLEIERKKIRKKIAFRDGRIVGCASNDPAALLGHFLISRGKLNERSLQYALNQKGEDQRLSDILVEMGLVTDEEVTAAFAETAEQTIYSLFEWQNAIFRFQLDATLDTQVEVDLSVEHTLLNGATRHDELQRIRGMFPSSGLVLRRTSQPLPANPESGALVFPVLELVDGQRTLAEILLQAHASEYRVLRLLFELQGNGNVEIAEEREVGEEISTLIDERVDDDPVALPSIDDFLDDDDDLDEPQATIDAPSVEEPTGLEPVVTESESTEKVPEAGELAVLIQFASNRLENGDPEGALSMLDACYKARPEDQSLKEVIDKAESAYLHQVRQYLLSPEKIPVLAVSEAQLIGQQLTATETSLLGMIDGNTNIQSIVWIAPLREVEVMRTLQQLQERGLIRFDLPADAAAADNTDEAAASDVELDPEFVQV